MINLAIILAEVVLLFLVSRQLTRAFSSLLFRASQSEGLTVQLLSFLLLPGIIIHELAHLLTAAVLLVPVGEIEFLPKVREGSVKLGSVAIGKTDPVRRALIGLAPVIIGVSLLWATSSFYSQTPYQLWSLESAVLAYVVFEVSNTMFSSMKDLEGLLETVLVAVLFGGFFYVFSQIANFNLPTLSLPLEAINSLAAPLIMPLTLAIGINGALVVILRLINR